MRSSFTKCLSLLLAGVLLVSSMLLSGGPAQARIMKDVGPASPLGDPIQQAALFDSVYGKENGHDVLYTTSSGTPAKFNVVDLTTNTLLRAIPLPVGNAAWTHVVAPDGTVYIGISDGGTYLYRYFPETGSVVNLGQAVNNAKSIWALTVDQDGNVYGGTFDSGKVFQYNPATNSFRDYGVMIEGRAYVRSIAYKDGKVYAGIGTVGNLVELDVVSGAKTIIPLKTIQGLTEYPFVYGLDIRGNYLFAFLSGEGVSMYIIYDLANKTWLPVEYPGASGLHVSPIHNNKVYFLQNKQLMEFDLTTQNSVSTGLPSTSSLRNSAWVQPDGIANPVLATIAYAGSTIFFDLVAGRVTTKVPVVQGSSLLLHAIEKGPDGVLYMSGYIAATGAKYNPADGQFSVFSIGQAESIGVHGNLVYFGVYPSGEISVYDVTKPLQNNASLPDQNPRVLFHIGNEQDRPYVNTFGDGKAFFGSIPDYGKIGGALTIFDESNPSGTQKVYRNIVQGQSIVGLAYRNGLIYGSTTIKGGLDSTTTATEAKMFIWDVANETKIYEWTPVIPGTTDKPIMISGLTFDSQGLLWATADGSMFAIDPTTREIVKSKVIFSGVKNYGMWRPIHNRFSDDGLLYSDIYGKVVIINPNTLEHLDLGITTSLFTLGNDSSLYYAQAGTLMKRTVTDAVYASPGELKLQAPQTAAVSSKFEVKINIADAHQLYGADLKITFDPSKVALKEIKSGTAFADNSFTDHRILNEQGTARTLLTRTGPNGVNGDADILTLVFEPKAKGFAAITLKAGSSVGGVHTATSGILYPTTADQTANVFLKETEDVNSDGAVNEFDLIAIAKQVGKSSFNPIYDLNADNKVDISDVSLVALALFK